MAGSSDTYKVGLHNVGSYQVSGRPWLKDVTLTGVESRLFEFPNVTEFIHICNDHNSSNHNLDIVFCEPKRGLQMANQGTNPDVSYSASGFSYDEFTLSLWVKIVDLELTKFFDLRTDANSSFRLQIHSLGPDSLRLFVDNTPTIISSVPFVAGEYYNIVASFSSGESKLFINGDLLATATTTFSDPVTSITLGSTDTNGFDGVYEQAILYGKSLTEDQALEVYRANGIIGRMPLTLSIQSIWEFEDNQYKNFYAIPDTTSTIYDRKSSFNLTRTNTATEAFVDGRQITNAFARHKITLTGQQQIDLHCKTKQIFVRSTNNLDLSICAGLTNIPSDRMHDLTGTGIDD